jgi:hypothetical protein
MLFVRLLKQPGRGGDRNPLTTPAVSCIFNYLVVYKNAGMNAEKP